MNKLITLLLLCISSFVALSQSEISNSSKGIVHAIIVTDLNLSCNKIDLLFLNDHLDKIVRYTGLTLYKHEFDKHEQGYFNLIKDLKVKSSDVIFFYFVGHSGNRNGWPSWSNGEHSFNSSSIYRFLSEKNARLTIVMIDGSNIGKTQEKSQFKDDFLNEEIQEKYASTSDCYKYYYLYSQGSLLMSASEEGKLSWGRCFDGSIINGGSFFTHSFFESFSEIRYPSWEKLFSNTKLKTNNLCKKIGKPLQNPKFHSELLVKTQIDSIRLEKPKDEDEGYSIIENKELNKKPEGQKSEPIHNRQIKIPFLLWGVFFLAVIMIAIIVNRFKKNYDNASVTNNFSLEEISELERLCKESKLEDALQIIISKSNSSSSKTRKKEAILIYSNLRQLKKDQMLNMISFDDYSRSFSKNSLAIINLVQEIKIKNNCD